MNEKIKENIIEQKEEDLYSQAPDWVKGEIEKIEEINGRISQRLKFYDVKEGERAILLEGEKQD